MVSKNKMAWDYLQSEKYDARLKVIAEYLKGKTAGKVLYDLNCGTARLLKFLEPDFKRYMGNDSKEEYIETARAYGIPETYFEIKNDDRLFFPPGTQIDILMSIGSGAGDFVKNEYESATQNRTFFRMVQEIKPGIVIYEAVELYMDAHLSRLLDEQMPKLGYVLDKTEKVFCGDEWTGERIIHYYVPKL